MGWLRNMLRGAGNLVRRRATTWKKPQLPQWPKEWQGRSGPDLAGLSDEELRTLWRSNPRRRFSDEEVVDAMGQDTLDRLKQLDGKLDNIDDFDPAAEISPSEMYQAAFDEDIPRETRENIDAVFNWRKKVTPRPEDNFRPGVRNRNLADWEADRLNPWAGDLGPMRQADSAQEGMRKISREAAAKRWQDHIGWLDEIDLDDLP